ncbi:MAG: carbohydrate binding domain-containing protein [Planctomycetia bacterium]|nr:carbohydrate binding domain-containing protein [Planctomycetia bacterium]
MKKILILWVLFSISVTAEDLRPLPVAKPVLAKHVRKRFKPELKVDTFTYQPHGAKEIKRCALPYFQMGNKAIHVRKDNGTNRPDVQNAPTIYVDGKQVGRLSWWGVIPGEGGGFGYPYPEIADDPGRLSFDQERGWIRYERPFAFTSGAKGRFTYTLTAIGDGQVALVWEVTAPQEELERLAEQKKSIAPGLWFNMERAYRGKKLTWGGEEWIQGSRRDLLEKNGASWRVKGDFTYAAESPGKDFSIQWAELQGNLEEHLTISQPYGEERYHAIWRTQGLMQYRVVIDLGEAETAATALPPVNGHDFWAFDGIDVPFPGGRNLMRNGSFEQGFRYWKGIAGGARYTPDPLPRYDIVEGGMFGKHALILRSNSQHWVSGVASFVYPLEKGKTYTVSFYAKSEKPTTINVTLASGANGGQFHWLKNMSHPDSRVSVTTEWQRYHRTWTDDGAGLFFEISGSGNTLLDGFQLEEGSLPTEYVEPLLSGMLRTSNPWNDLVYGEPIEARFACYGKKGVRGAVTLEVVNAYRESFFRKRYNVTFREDGTKTIPLDFDAANLGTGIYNLKVTYEADGQKWRDYFRFSIMTPLSNTHKTKNVFGNLLGFGLNDLSPRLARKYMEWGFGSTSWGGLEQLENGVVDFMREYRIQNFFHGVAGMGPKEVTDVLRGYKEWTEITPEREKYIEQHAYQMAERFPKDLFPVWGFGNEEEGSVLVAGKKFDEYFKAQSAVARGVKRSNPDAVIVPTCGTSGYSLLRGYDAIEGYLAASVRHKFKYDAIAVHPYWNLDRGALSGLDLDEETQRLVAQMARYGYGKETPIFFTELFNIPEGFYPLWGQGQWGDSWLWGKFSYDFGNREWVQASCIARTYILCLKFFPQVQHANIWRSCPYMDRDLSPYLFCKAVNTLGHLMGDVAFYRDVRPFANVRGYAFKLPDGSGLVALWSTDPDVDNGIKTGAVLEVQLDQPVTFYDLMGNQRIALKKKGWTQIPLTPAPLFVKARDLDKLCASLLSASIDDPTVAVRLSVEPQKDGTVRSVIQNLTGMPQSGKLEWDGGATLDYDVAANATVSLPIPDVPLGAEAGKRYAFARDYTMVPKGGRPVRQTWTMDYFYVPKCGKTPDWSTIPSIPLTNRFRKYVKVNGSSVLPEVGKEGDLEVSYQAAWNEANFFLRVTVTDDRVLDFPELWNDPLAEQLLHRWDACVEVYFDCGANARKKQVKGYDQDDYCYDFAPPRDPTSKRSAVWRLREVNGQFADGLDMPTKADAQKQIVSQWEKTDMGYVYTITFPEKFLRPIRLEEGFTTGFGLFVHDRDDAAVPAKARGLSNAVDAGMACENNPHLFPLMMFR